MTPAVPFPAWDDSLFALLNGRLHAAPLDAAMLGLTWLSTAKVGLALLIAAVFLAARGWRRPVAWVAALLALGVDDLLVDRVVKRLVHRPRPLDAHLAVRALVELRHSLGFPSAHAANSAAVAAVLLALGHRRAGWVCAALSVWLGWSRVYVGVHRPLDVVGGWVIGAAVGWGVGLAARRYGARRGPA